MTSKQAIKKLMDFHPFYSLEFNVATSGVKDVVAVSSVLRLLEKVPSEKGEQTQVKRVVTVYGAAATIKLAQDDAIVTAVEMLGL